MRWLDNALVRTWKRPGFTRADHRINKRLGSHTPVPVAHPEKPTTDPARWLGGDAQYLGHGWVSDVWANDEWVVKVGKEVIPQADMMPTRDDEKRAVLAAQTLAVIEGLRASPEFRHFRHLLPETYVPAPFVILQKRQSGLRLEHLSDSAKAVAERFQHEIWTAGRRALPGVEIDVNAGNLFFDTSGTPTSLFDPAGGGSWAATWMPGMPAGLDVHLASREIIDRHVKEKEPGRYSAKGPHVELAGVLAQPVTGKGLQDGQAVLIANVARNSAFLLTHHFRQAYESRSFPVTEGGQLSNALGLPIENERTDPLDSGRRIQRFENGSLSWTRARGVAVHLRPDLTASLPLIHQRWAEGGWETRGPITALGGGFARKVEGQSLKFGDAYFVANPGKGQAFLVKHGFRYAYTSVLFPESQLRPLHEVLGVPTGDERQEPMNSGRYVQEFEHGQLTWTEAEGVRVTLKKLNDP